MDDRDKLRLDKFESRFQYLEKRHDDMRFYVGVPAAFLGVIFGLFSYFANSNFKDERTQLRDFEQDMRSDLGREDAYPNLQLLGFNGDPLTGQVVPAKVTAEEKGEKLLEFAYVLRNVGTRTTRPMFLKLYSSQPIQLGNQSTDENTFKYEAFVAPDKFNPGQLPGGNYSSAYTVHFVLANDVPSGRYPVLLKVYYGDGKVVQAQFIVNITKAS